MTGTPESRITALGLVFLALLLVTGLLLESFLPVAAMLAALFVLVLMVGSSLRMLALILSVHIIFTISQLGSYSVYLGFVQLRPDDFLLAWLVILWIAAIVDGRTRGLVYGKTGSLIFVFLILSVVAAVRGLSGGADPASVSIQLKTFSGYLFFFPAVWIASDARARRVIWVVILTATVVAALLFMLKGVVGAGEGVYYRIQTGIRIATRQPNAIAAVMLMLIAVLWKDRRKPPLIIAIPAIIAMIGAVIISQTRALWVGVAVALVAGWILNLVRKEAGVLFRRKFILSVATALLVLVLALFAISSLGILSVEDITRRTTSETGNYLFDPSILSRFLAWNAVLSEVSGTGVLAGNGFGATLTYYNIDYAAMRTVFWVDGSFFQTYLNMGLIGCFVLGFLYVTVITGSARLFLRTSSRERAATALGIFCAMTAILIASVGHSLTVNYRYTILWAVLMAVLQTETVCDLRESIHREGADSVHHPG